MLSCSSNQVLLTLVRFKNLWTLVHSGLVSILKMKKFIYKASLSTILVLIVLVSVNYFGDAAKLFSSNYEKVIATILLNGKNVTNISNYDERRLQKELIENLKKTPDIVILGSSRTMLINNEYFIDQFLLNNSVSGASIEDLISIYQIYKSKGMIPGKVIIGIDPWLFNENNNQSRWKTLENEYNEFFEKDLIFNDNLYKYKQLLSPSYFQSSIKQLGKNSEPQATLHRYNKGNTKLTDGSLTYNKLYREASNSKINIQAQNYIQGNIYSIENFKQLSPKLLKDFELLIKDLKINNIQIIFFLAPYHPTVYDEIKSDYPMVLKTEEFIRSFARKKNIEILGSFNPTKIGVDENYFYDGMHSKEKGIKIILNSNTN
jgi:hypothetical protein